MPRSIWTGAISFGLVTVPVKLYSATASKTVRFNQLNRETGARIAQKRVDSSTGEEVEYAEIVKGFEIASGRYVTIDPGELEAVQPKKTKTIEIEDFVELDEIDPIFYVQPYYLAPAAGGAKPYRLLHQAMSRTGKVAIARLVLRQKESLVAVRPMGDALGLSTMLFADEVVDPSTIEDLVGVADIEGTDREVAIAEQLIASLAAPFDPSKYRDSYRDAVLEMIERKAAGEQVTEAPSADEEPEGPPDLMAALKASIAAVQARTGDGNGAAEPAKRARSTSAAKKPAAKKPAAKKPAAKKPAAKKT
jgi:DNA end-binding protein Ku